MNVLLLAAPASFDSDVVALKPQVITIAVGETSVATGSITFTGAVPWLFDSTNTSIASVAGSIPAGSGSAPIVVTGLAPGQADIVALAPTFGRAPRVYTVGVVIVKERPSCISPGIVAPMATVSIESGQRASLSVRHSGSGPFTYSWFLQEESGPTRTYSSAGPTLTTERLYRTTTYWVRVQNECGSTTSARGSIQIVQPACIPPNIVSPLQEQSIPSGQPVTLRLELDGSLPLIYQWFSQEDGKPVIAYPRSFDQAMTSAPLLRTTTFWAQVENECGLASTAPVVITVLPPRSRSVRH
jgi:hypothetical protein